MELSAFLSCQPFLFPIPQKEQQQEEGSKNGGDHGDQHGEGSHQQQEEDNEDNDNEKDQDSNFDQKWIHRARTLELNSFKKMNKNKDNIGKTRDGNNSGGRRRININNKNKTTGTGGGDDVDEDQEEPNEVLLHLVDHVVSVEPAVSHKLMTEEKNNENDNNDDDDASEQEEDEDEEGKEGITSPSFLGPAFFIPKKSNSHSNTASSSSSTSTADGDNSNNNNENFDFGMYPIELALITSKNIKDMPTETMVSSSSNSTKKNNKQHREATKAATALPAAKQTVPVMNDADTVLLAKIGYSDDCHVYQINLSLLRRVERVQSDDGDDDDSQKHTADDQGDDDERKKNPKIMGKDDEERPSCLLLHFPGCTFRIFDPSPPSGTESSVSPSKSSPTNLHSKSSASSSTDVGEKGHNHQYLHSSDGTTPNTTTEGTSSRIDEAQIVVHDTLDKIITSSEDFYLPFPLYGLRLIAEDNDKSNKSDCSRSRFEESMSRRRSHHTVFAEVFELESILSSLANEMVENSSSSSSSSSSIIDDALRQRLRHLMTSIPSNVFTSISSLDESLIETMSIYDEAIDENGLKLSDLLKKFFGSDSDTKHSNKRRRFGHSSSSKSKPKSPASSSLTPAQALHDQKDHAKTTCQLLAQNKKLLSHKYELLSLAER